MSDNLQAAKDSLTIEDLGARYFPGWKSGRSCKSPFRDENKNSFSVFDNGRKWKDFGTGQSGDAVDFLALATGLSNTEAVKMFVSMAGCRSTPVRPVVSHKEAIVKTVVFPDGMHKGKPGEVAALANLRNVVPEAVEILGERGLLRFASMRDGVETVKAWIVTDKARVNGQARRLDGLPWQSLPGQPKAKTLPGSVASWPVGIHEARDLPVIALVEGSPDTLAAMHFAYAECKEDRVAPVAMLGSSLSIPEDALGLFSGKRVRIFPHLDDAGHEAGARWEKQLTAVGVDVDCFSLEGISMTGGGVVGDLNDLTAIHADAFESDRDLWNIFDIAEGGRS
jgi:hypothetical protein